ncbi:MAG: T9SS type A sorting domain-containing protein [Candidatus Marinimicrobia bacterium]|nr:T9SS type A sorting domain-containing protein [Candidatus Neomarinimicrobiota bacterium]
MGKLTAILIILVSTVILMGQVPAFPGAQGWGMYTTGGRGGRVIEVTNLNDYGSGSLRYAVENCTGPRIVVFRVSGNIDLKSPLDIKNDNVTIAGQTAPGDGICIRYYPAHIEANNVIIRYLRFRLGDKKGIVDDALNARGQRNIIIDHCSLSWSVDEVGSFYDNKNFTLQWCIISESLYHSIHHKGNHGYGGIWGGMGASFHHNLIAHNSSRNPRFCGSRYHNHPELEKVDFRNNVIYNWGFNSAYGGEKGNHNIVANYYKHGPATNGGEVLYRIVNPSDISWWYVEDNYVYGFPDVTADNWSGGVQPDGSLELEDLRLDEPVEYMPVLTHTPEVAFELVLADAGAVLPRRDSVDMRIVDEVRNGTATYGGVYGEGKGIIDSQDDVGGWPELRSEEPPIDSDHDGMPDDWEIEMDLDPNDPSDGPEDMDGDGYTNVEEYLNELCIRDDFILAPGNLRTITLSPYEVKLIWDELSENEEGFIVERSAGDTSSFIEIGRVEKDSTTFIDTGLQPATRYYYRVKAYNSKINSLPTNIAEGWTLFEDGRPIPSSNPFPPDSAENVEILTELKWKPGAGALSHNLYFGTSLDNMVYIANLTENKYFPDGLYPSTRYYWRVDEVNEAGTTEGNIWTFSTEDIASEMVAYWKFNRSSGTICIDETGNRNYAYLKGDVSWQEGLEGNAIYFAGSGGYVYVEHSKEIDFSILPFTITFWMKPEITESKQIIFSKRELLNGELTLGYDISLRNENQLKFSIFGSKGTVSLSGNIPTDGTNWVFVVAQREGEGGQVKLYINGELVDSKQDAAGNIFNKSYLYIGRDILGNDYYTGYLDEVKIFNNMVLTDDEIMEMYNELEIDENRVAGDYQLKISNYPNPFNSKTLFEINIPAESELKLIVFDLQGKVVKEVSFGKIKSGRHYYSFDGSSLPSGVYFYKVYAGEEVKHGKMLLLK